MPGDVRVPVSHQNMVGHAVPQPETDSVHGRRVCDHMMQFMGPIVFNNKQRMSEHPGMNAALRMSALSGLWMATEREPEAEDVSRFAGVSLPNNALTLARQNCPASCTQWPETPTM